MTARLTNRVALVTGAAGGIGAAICRRFAEEGACVLLTDSDSEGVEAVAASISAVGGRAQALTLDVCDENGWQQAIATAVSAFGRLDILVNNAGIALRDTAESATLSDWQRMQRVNGEGVFLGTRAAIGVMKEHGGSIINLSSIAGKIGAPQMASYNFSKGGVCTFSKSAALHCCAQNYPIRVNSIHPGFIATDMFDDGFRELEPEAAERARNKVVRSIPMRRLGRPVDIANGCVFLASDEAGYVTGSELVIDGGYTCQ